MEQPGASNIPEFQTLQEAAEFWDTHSPEDFPDDFEDVEVEITARRLRRVLELELDDTQMNGLKSQAQQQGTTPSELARQWVLAQLAAKGVATT